MVFATRQQGLPLPLHSKSARSSEGDDIRSNPMIFFGILGMVLCCEWAYQQQVRAADAREHEFQGSEIELFHAWHGLYPAAGTGADAEVTRGDAVLADDGNILENLLLSTPEENAPADVKTDYVDSLESEGVGNGVPGLVLDWGRVKSWAPPPASRFRSSASAAKDLKASAAFVSHADLFGATWRGKAPKVACVTIVPRGSADHAWITHFIDNFRLQQYEGERHLVVIYHREDAEARHILQMHADGISIQGAAVNDTDLPSAAAFRYGAWLAGDADVIARWDFGAWYHPTRLALQVKALASSGRPASRLGSWTLSDGSTGTHAASPGDGKESDGRQQQADDHADGTLIGEASWMRRNWFPTLDANIKKSQPLDARHLTLVVDAPELAVFPIGELPAVPPQAPSNDVQ